MTTFSGKSRPLFLEDGEGCLSARRPRKGLFLARNTSCQRNQPLLYCLFLTPAFFEVKTRKEVPDAPNQIGLFTNDLPPIPVNVSDSCHITFRIENNIFGAGTRFMVAEADFAGGELWRTVESADPKPATAIVTNDVGEFGFVLQGTVYVLRSILVYVPLAQLKKYVKEV